MVIVLITLLSEMLMWGLFRFLYIFKPSFPFVISSLSSYNDISEEMFFYFIFQNSINTLTCLKLLKNVNVWKLIKESNDPIYNKNLFPLKVILTTLPSSGISNLIKIKKNKKYKSSANLSSL